MPIETRFINVIIPINKIIELKGKNWWNNYLKEHKRWLDIILWYDENIFRDGTMSEYDLEDIIKFWRKEGFNPKKIINGQEYWNDLCVVDSMDGPTLPCDWLEFNNGIASLKGHSGKKVIGPIWKSDIVYFHQLGTSIQDDPYNLHRQIPYELKLRLDDYKILTVFKPIIINGTDKKGNKNVDDNQKLLNFSGSTPVGEEAVGEEYKYQINGEITNHDLSKIKLVFKNEGSVVQKKEYIFTLESFGTLIKKIIQDCFEIYKLNRQYLDFKSIYSADFYQKLLPLRDSFLNIFEWLQLEKMEQIKVKALIDSFKTLLKVNKNCGEIYYYLGRIYYLLKQMDDCHNIIKEGLAQSNIDYRLVALRDSLFIQE